MPRPEELGPLPKPIGLSKRAFERGGSLAASTPAFIASLSRRLNSAGAFLGEGESFLRFGLARFSLPSLILYPEDPCSSFWLAPCIFFIVFFGAAPGSAAFLFGAAPYGFLALALPPFLPSTLTPLWADRSFSSISSCFARATRKASRSSPQSV